MQLQKVIGSDKERQNSDKKNAETTGASLYIISNTTYLAYNMLKVKQ